MVTVRSTGAGITGLMPLIYLGDTSSIRRCNESRRTGQAINVSGLDLSGNFASFTGIVQSVEITRDVAKEKRFLVTINEIGAT
jgi:hypothetical protein